MVRLDEDWHVHSTFSDGHDTVDANVRAAETAGLRTLCLVDHVRADTTWVPQFVAETCRAAEQTDVRVLCGLEAKMLDTRGTLDLPADHVLADHLLIADHQVPSPDGPVDPERVRQLIAAGDLSGTTAIDWLIRAYEGALRRYPGAILAHPFSVVPKIGLAPSDLRVDGVRRLAQATLAAGSRIEISERWRCPEAWIVEEFLAAGVTVHVSTDAHRATRIGRYDHCAALVAALRAPVART